MEAYREFASRRLWQFPALRETRTYAVIEVKDGGPLPVCRRQAGTEPGASIVFPESPIQ